MATRTGTRVALTADLGEGPGRLHKGAEGRVVAVHAPGTAGVGHAHEDSVLVSFTQPGSEVPRFVTVSQSDFSGLFKNIRKTRATNGG